MIPKSHIALALSGGGIRAMAFHMGFLKALAERGLLEKVNHISTVSGGSFLVGLIYHENQLEWPSSAVYLETIYPKLREKIRISDIGWGAIRKLINPFNWRFILSRANLISMALRSDWGIEHKLSALPIFPEWSINGTPAEYGVRFRFKRDSIGDYSLGYAEPKDFMLADAIAVSAGFPGFIGPLVFKTTPYEWRKWTPLGLGPVTTPAYPKLHLYDGGVYDNLGLEPLFDCGTIETKLTLEDSYIIVSDAGAPLEQGFKLGPLHPFRLKRVMDIIANQARSLRIRSFTTYMRKCRHNGAYIYINSPVTNEESCPEAAFASRYSTTFFSMKGADFDRIANHGYNVAKKVEKTFGLYS